jgi:glycerol-3-phosphate dehydrogenase
MELAMPLLTRRAGAAERRAQAVGPLQLSRPDNLRALEGEPFDILVIGGGVTGAYTALDAALRVCRVALVEKDDFASGTSSKSSKLVHGGIRYLEQGNVALVRHSLLERHRLRENAPHLVHRLPFVFPILGKDSVIDKRLEAGFAAMLHTYDVVGGWREGVLHARLSRQEVAQAAPTLRADQLLRGYLFYDARADDARLTLTIARTAAFHGATILNHAKAAQITRRSGRVSGAVIEADGREVEVSAKVVVMATGSWLRDFSGAAPDADVPTIRPAKGVHIAVPWLKLRNTTTLTIGVPGQKTRATVTRWGDSVVVGTTDDDFSGDLDTVLCTGAERDTILAAINQSFDVDMTEQDVTGTIAGTRPLVAKGSGGTTREIPRSHEIRIDHDGLVSVVGGKLTTARHMAEQTVDAAQKVLGRRARTRSTHAPLLGGAGYDSGSAEVSGGLQAHLAGRYGTEARHVSALVAERPELGEPLVAGQPYIAAEVVYAARHELAAGVDDVLARRTRARFHARDASLAAAGRVADLLAAELGWSDTAKADQLAQYRASVNAEREALGLPASVTEQEKQ